MALTGKKLAFARAVLAGKSNKDAAIAAQYSLKTAGPAGSRLAKDLDVKKYLAAQKKAGAGEKKASSRAKAPPPNSTDGLPVDDVLTPDDDPREFLRQAMKNPLLDPRQRIAAAKALMPFEHAKKGESSGKKESDAAKTRAAGAGRFGRREAPKLVAAGGKKL